MTIRRTDRGGLHPRAGDLFGLDETTVRVDPVRIVGWYRRAPFLHVAGTDHLCLQCAPDQPPDREPVYAPQLAAAQPCGLCGRKLEDATP